MPIVTKYDYQDVPTIAKFAASNAFIRGLVGPFGCLSGDTEVLTPFGWRRIDTYKPQDDWRHNEPILMWNPDGTTEFIAPFEYISGPSKDLIEFESRTLTMRLSNNHRVPHYDWNGVFKVSSAGEIAEKPSRRKVPVVFSAPKPIVHLGMSDDLIRFAVMMHADGHYPKTGKKAAICVRKDRKKWRIRQLLTALQVEWTEHSTPKRSTEITFRFIPPYIGKRFNSRWYSATQSQLEVILDEVVHWDGFIEDDGLDLRYFTSVKEDADFIQYAAHACGRVGILNSVEYKNQNWKTTYVVGIRSKDSLDNCAAIRSEMRIKCIPALNGMQYCFRVPSGFFVARCNDRVFITGNSGKSSGCVVEIIRRAMAQRIGTDGLRHSRWVVIRSTMPQLEDTTIKTFMQWVPPQNFGRYWESDHTYLIKGIPGCEIEIMFRALDRPDHIRNLLSLEVTGAWVNEAREVPWGIIEALQGRVGRYPAKSMGGITWSGIFMDTNPPDVDSRWYKFFEEDKHPPEFAQIFKQPSGLSSQAENLTNLPSTEYYKRLAVGKSPEWIKVYVDGEYGFVIDGKPVYREYNDQAHCKVLQPIKGVVIYRSWDWGLTPACVFSQVLPDGRWLIFDEIISEDTMGADRFSDEVITFSGINYPGAEFKDIGDPAGESRAQTDERTCFQILQAKGIDIEGGEQNVTIRLESVRKPLRTMIGGEPQFVLHPRCKVLRKGFLGGYKFRRMQVSIERYTSKPEKDKYSHPHDALQYAATRIFGSSLTNMAAHLQEDFSSTSYHQSDQGRSVWTGY